MMCDDQRWDAMSSRQHDPQDAEYGPHRREGISSRTRSSPTRSAGEPRDDPHRTYSHTNGMIDNRPKTDIKPDAPWMPDLLGRGLRVAFCGKSHQKNAVRDRKWDYYFGYKGQGRYKDPIIAEGTDGQDKVYRDGWTTSSPTTR